MNKVAAFSSALPFAALAEPSETTPIAVIAFHLHFMKLNMFFRVFRALFLAFPDCEGLVSRADRESQDSLGESNQKDTQTHEHQFPRLHKLWSLPTHLARQPTAGPIVKELGGRARIHCEAFLTSVIALSRRHDNPSIPGEPIPSPITCAPDHICYAMLMGPAFISKLHLLGVTHFQKEMNGADLVRSLMARVHDAFRAGAAGSLAASGAASEGPYLFVSCPLPQLTLTHITHKSP